jgi:toxin ParE1/3/4
MHVRFTENALQDLYDIHDYIALDNPLEAKKITSRITYVTDLLSSFPLIGREGLVENTREFYVSRTSYVIIYAYDDPLYLDILNVIHTSKLWPKSDE